MKWKIKKKIQLKFLNGKFARKLINQLLRLLHDVWKILLKHYEFPMRLRNVAWACSLYIWLRLYILGVFCTLSIYKRLPPLAYPIHSTIIQSTPPSYDQPFQPETPTSFTKVQQPLKHLNWISSSTVYLKVLSSITLNCT